MGKCGPKKSRRQVGSMKNKIIWRKSAKYETQKKKISGLQKKEARSENDRRLDLDRCNVCIRLGDRTTSGTRGRLRGKKKSDRIIKDKRQRRTPLVFGWQAWKKGYLGR